MKINEKRIRRAIYHAGECGKWERCMFGYTIHLPDATIRVYVKKKSLKSKNNKSFRGSNVKIRNK